MKSIVALLLCSLAGARAAGDGKDHPVVKVIAMLKDLKAKSISEGKSEAVSYEKFTYWCSTSKAELKAAIAQEKETIDELEDSIAGKKKAAASFEEKIGKLEEEIKNLQASAKSAKDDRASGEKLYTKVSDDLGSTIKAVSDCIKALEGAQTTTEPKMMLAQTRVRSLIALVSMKATEQQLQTLVNFADPARPEQLAKGDLEKHTDKYDFKSENVIELLKNLQLKFEDDLTEATKEETNAINAYQLSKSARDNAIKAAEKSKEEKGTALAETNKALADAESNLKDTTADLEADTKALSTTDESCSTKKSEWETRSKTRTLEIAAMDAAVEILGKATGVRTEAPGNPVPPASPVVFLQMSAAGRPNLDAKMKAVTLLRKTATELHSNALERLSMEVSNHLNGPFDVVSGMVQKMIFRLMDEQKSEDEHKLWCDQELEKTNTMKDDKDQKIEVLNAAIKAETATVSKLTEEIAEANKMISDIKTFMQDATEIRNVGKSENNLAIKDAQSAQTAVSNAIAVLEAFYKESGAVAKEPWEFIQTPVKLGENPATWDSPYNAVSGPKDQPGGIITVLENINADFSKMEAETKSQEQVDQKEFEEAVKANEIEKARRNQEADMKNAEKARRTEKITSLQSSKKNTAAELEKTEQYLEDLKPACVNGDSTYDDRKAARAKEIESLKQAQGILADAFKEKSGAFLQARTVRRHF